MKWLHSCLLIIVSLGVTGCSAMEYYWQAINGHTDILNREPPIRELLAKPDLEPELRIVLEEMQRARDFASVELGLPENNSYREYADIGRDYVIWNVIATEEFSVDPQTWCFPFAGCVNYRGFFTKSDAEDFAKQLSSEGKDVYVAGARAYSTLGWFDDPLLNTMLYRDEAMRVAVLFHELAHQKLYVQDDTAFNEAFATAVAQEGVRRWFLHNGNISASELYLESEQRRAEFNTLLKNTRTKLHELYQQSHDPASMRKEKQTVFLQLKNDYAKLKQNWDSDNRYDVWMGQSLNNAHLALAATYHELVPAFKAYLREAKADLPRFYRQMEQLARLPKDERHQHLVVMVNKQNISQLP
ncbi:MAG: aminopeptidase [Halobacteria archaeon]|nr:aminopeptidase [Halobacteria archaeon]